MHRIIMGTTLLLGMALGLFAVAPAMVSAQDLYNCGDFASQSDAQQVYNYDPSDPNQLDGNDGDGIVCESGTNGSLTFADYLAAIGAAPPVVNPPAQEPETGTNPVPPGGEGSGPEDGSGPGNANGAGPGDEDGVGPVETSTGTGGTTTTSATGGTTTASLPSTGSGTTATASTSTTTILLALFAAFALVAGTVGLVRSRRI